MYSFKVALLTVCHFYLDVLLNDPPQKKEMSSNTLFESAFLQSDHFSFELKNDTIRTNFLLENIFSYMLGSKYDFAFLPALNAKERDTLELYKRTLDIFEDTYDLKYICDEINEETLCNTLFKVADELFSEGITWSRIIAFFVFVKHLTHIYIQKADLPTFLVDEIFESFSKSVKMTSLESWIEFHGGWEGISSFQIEKKKFRAKKVSWVKILFHGVIKTFGIFSALGNIVNDNFYY